MYICICEEMAGMIYLKNSIWLFKSRLVLLLDIKTKVVSPTNFVNVAWDQLELEGELVITKLQQNIIIQNCR